MVVVGLECPNCAETEVVGAALAEQQARERMPEVVGAVVREPRPLQESAEDDGGVVLVHQGAVRLGEQPLGLAGALAERLRPQPGQVARIARSNAMP